MWLCCLLLALLPEAREGEDTVLARTTRIVRPEVRAAFYRSGGRLLLGRRVHLHVESAILRRSPRIEPSQREGDTLVFENRSVPVVVHSRNRYWLQVARHLNDAREFCIRGVLREVETDPDGRIHLFVDKIQRAPGTWSYRSDG